jgi:hypothetical protein
MASRLETCTHRRAKPAVVRSVRTNHLAWLDALARHPGAGRGPVSQSDCLCENQWYTLDSGLRRNDGIRHRFEPNP